METDAGVQLTENQIKCIRSLKRVLKNWDHDLCINSIAGTLTVMLRGDTKQNPYPELSRTGGFNPDNVIETFLDVLSDGGGW